MRRNENHNPNANPFPEDVREEIRPVLAFCIVEAQRRCKWVGPVHFPPDMDGVVP